jgi:RecB family exonuclease
VLRRPELADALEASARRAGEVSAGEAIGRWERRHWRLSGIDRLREAAERGPTALIARASRELEWLFCLPRRGTAGVLEHDELDEARALVAGRRALGELAELARLAPELAPADAEELSAAIADIQILAGDRPVAGKVAVLDPLAMRARRVRAIFLCRLQQGVFPAPTRAPTLLGADERRAIAAVSNLRLGSHDDAVADERYLFYAAVSRPKELLALSWHTADEAGALQSRSLFVDDVCDLFDGARVKRGRASAARVPGRRSCASHVRSGELWRGAGPARARALRDGRLLVELRAHTWSPSSLERWIRCPVGWFVERWLRADDLQPQPEPMARGGLAHAALRDTFEDLRRQTGSARLSMPVLDLARELLRRALQRHEVDHPLSVARERRPGLRRRLSADLERYLEFAARREDARSADGPAPEPTHMELAFGFGPNSSNGGGRWDAGDQACLPALDLGGGVLLRGRIDRIDVAGGGDAVVYDYKGANVSPGAKWLSDGALQVALYMKAAEDLLGLRAVGGFYQPLRGRDLRPRGLLDGDGAVTVDCPKTDRREHSAARALLYGAVEAAREAAAQAADGELEPRPQTCTFGGGCRYPAICGCRR